jgi:WhiB family redox-sensing transcriptional regulator
MPPTLTCARPVRSTRADWRNHAACRDMDTELFFPAGTTGLALDQIGRAKQVCAECLVRNSCLEWALATGRHASTPGAGVLARAFRSRQSREPVRVRLDVHHRCRVGVGGRATGTVYD